MGCGLRQKKYLCDLERVSDMMRAKVYINFWVFCTFYSCHSSSLLLSEESLMDGVKDVDRFLQHFGQHICNKKFVSLVHEEME